MKKFCHLGVLSLTASSVFAAVTIDPIKLKNKDGKEIDIPVQCELANNDKVNEWAAQPFATSSWAKSDDEKEAGKPVASEDRNKALCKFARDNKKFKDWIENLENDETMKKGFVGVFPEDKKFFDGVPSQKDLIYIDRVKIYDVDLFGPILGFIKMEIIWRKSWPKDQTKEQKAKGEKGKINKFSLCNTLASPTSWAPFHN